MKCALNTESPHMGDFCAKREPIKVNEPEFATLGGRPSLNASNNEMKATKAPSCHGNQFYQNPAALLVQ